MSSKENLNEVPLHHISLQDELEEQSQMQSQVEKEEQSVEKTKQVITDETPAVTLTENTPKENNVICVFIYSLLDSKYIHLINIILLCINFALICLTILYTAKEDNMFYILGFYAIFLLLWALCSLETYDKENKIRSIFRNALAISNIIYLTWIITVNIFFFLSFLIKKANTYINKF